MHVRVFEREKREREKGCVMSDCEKRVKYQLIYIVSVAIQMQAQSESGIYM